MTGDAGKTLSALAAAAAIAVLMAFVNIGGLLMVRSIDRRRELAIRTALGARPAVIARRMLIETQLLVALGIAGGSLLAIWITAPLARLSLAQFGGTAPMDVAVDWAVIFVIAVVASIGGGLCTLPPALAAARRDVADTLRRGATPTRRELALRRMFVGVQVALAFALMASVATVGGTLRRLLGTSPGFAAHGVLLMKLSPPAANYSDARVVSFYSALLEALAGRLGRGSIAAVNEVPLDGSLGRRVLRRTPDDAGREAIVREVTSDYFAVMRIPVIAGRPLDERDHALAARQIVISESLADLLGWMDPVGQQIFWSSPSERVTIAGVVADVKHQRLDEKVQPTVYVSAAQSPSRSMVLVARSERPMPDVLATVRDEVARLDASLPVYGIVTLSDVVARSQGMRERRVITATFAGFAMLAIVLASVGLLATTAHDVLLRDKEFALRTAMGAPPSRILGAVLHQAAVTLAAGAAGGAALSLWVNGALVAAGVTADRVTPLSIGLPAAAVTIAGLIAVLPAARSALTSAPASILRD
jgi:putative ABC transport system permease protein